MNIYSNAGGGYEAVNVNFVDDSEFLVVITINNAAPSESSFIYSINTTYAETYANFLINVTSLASWDSNSIGCMTYIPDSN